MNHFSINPIQIALRHILRRGPPRSSRRTRHTSAISLPGVLFLCVVFIVFTAAYFYEQGGAVSYSFFQSDWLASADSTATAGHPPPTTWSRYQSKTTSILTGTDLRLSLPPTTQNRSDATASSTGGPAGVSIRVGGDVTQTDSQATLSAQGAVSDASRDVSVSVGPRTSVYGTPSIVPGNKVRVTWPTTGSIPGSYEEFALPTPGSLYLTGVSGKTVSAPASIQSWCTTFYANRACKITSQGAATSPSGANSVNLSLGDPSRDVVVTLNPYGCATNGTGCSLTDAADGFYKVRPSQRGPVNGANSGNGTLSASGYETVLGSTYIGALPSGVTSSQSGSISGALLSYSWSLTNTTASSYAGTLRFTIRHTNTDVKTTVVYAYPIPAGMVYRAGSATPVFSSYPSSGGSWTWASPPTETTVGCPSGAARCITYQVRLTNSSPTPLTLSGVRFTFGTPAGQAATFSQQYTYTVPAGTIAASSSVPQVSFSQTPTDGSAYSGWVTGLSLSGTTLTYTLNLSNASLQPLTVSAVNFVISVQQPVTGTVVSSPYNMTDPTALLYELRWTERRPPSTRVRVQLRTASTQSGLATAQWLGPDGQSTTYFERESAGCSSTGIDLVQVTCLIAASVAQPTGSAAPWFQHRVILDSDSGIASPEFHDIAATYDINASPIVSNVNAAQGSTGPVTISYRVTDPDQASTAVGVFYDVGLTLASDPGPSGTSITIQGPAGVPLSTLIPSPGVVMIDDEQIKYFYVGGNSVSGIFSKVLVRGAYNTKAASHTSGAKIWVRATDPELATDPDLARTAAVSGYDGAGNTVSCAAATSCTKTLSWNAADDLVFGAYNLSQSVRVVANDGQKVRQVSGADSAPFTLDTKAPALGSNPLSIGGTGVVSITGYGLKTKAIAVDLSIAMPDTTDDNAASANMMVFCNGSSCGAPAVAALRAGNAPGWSAPAPFSTTRSAWGLTNDQRSPHAVNMVVFDEKGNKTASSKPIVFDNTAPPQPNGFAVSDISTSLGKPAVYLKWNPLDWGSAGSPGDPRDGYQQIDFAAYKIYRDQKTCGAPISGFCPLATLNDQTTTSFVDESVTTGTKYTYRIIVSDNAGNEPPDLLAAAVPSGDATPKIGSGAPIAPPVISNVRIGSPTINSVKIQWDTDVPSDSRVAYIVGSVGAAGFDTASTQGNVTLATGGTETNGSCACHTVVLVGLEPGTTYSVEVRSSIPNTTAVGKLDRDGRGAFVFTTQSPPPPVAATFANVAASSVGERSATITWDTRDANSQPLNGDSFVEYGVSASLGSYYGQKDSVSHHSVTLPNGLQPDTTYYYRVHTTPGVANGTEGVFPAVAEAPLTFRTQQSTTDSAPPLISAISVTGIQHNTALISWTTDEPATSFVEFWAVGDQAHQLWPVAPGALVTAHRVQLPLDLRPDTDYAFKVISFDASNNRGESQEQPPFHTPTDPGDVPAPTISNIRQDSPGANTITIYWTTDVPSDSLVAYSANDQTFTQQQLNSFITTDHVVTLTNLSPATTYFFKVRSTNTSNRATEAATCGGTPCSFTTLASVAPAPQLIPGSIQVADLQANRATIRWKTTQSGNSLVEYGTALSAGGLPLYGRTFGDVKDSTTDHEVILPNDLIDDATYHFRVWTRDTAHQLMIYPATPIPTDPQCTASPTNCADPRFTTSASQFTIAYESKTPPVITSVRTLLVTDTKAVIGWTTDKPADSEVDYGNSALFGSHAEDRYRTSSSTTNAQALTRSHAITLEPLQPKTTYYFKVASTDIADQRAEDDKGGDAYSFTTNAGTGEFDEPPCPGCVVPEERDTTPPAISDLTVTDITDRGATITWRTDEDANALVNYGEATTDESLAGNANELAREHRVLLTNLNGDTEYRFVAISYDASANRTEGIEQSFKTTGVRRTIEEELQEAEDKLESAKQELATLSPSARDSVQKIADLLKDFSEKDAAEILAHLGLQLVAPPMFVGGRPSVEVTQTSATITWATDRPSDSRVAYMLDVDYDGKKANPYGLEVGNTEEFVMQHEVTIANLQPGTLYHYQIRSKERAGRTAYGPDRTFRTAAIKPDIAKVKLDLLGERSATFSWKTNVPTKTIIEYTSQCPKETPICKENKLAQGDTQFTLAHTLTLKDLQSDTNYVARIRSEDEHGLVNVSAPITFKTGKDVVAPEISQLRTKLSLSTGSSDAVQAVITWKTNEPGDTQVFHAEGVKKDDLLSKGETSGPQGEHTTNHTVVLNKLRPATVYRFKAVSRDGAGNLGASKEFKIITPRKEESVLELIIRNFEQAFGFLRGTRQ